MNQEIDRQQKIVNNLKRQLIEAEKELNYAVEREKDNYAADMDSYLSLFDDEGLIDHLIDFLAPNHDEFVCQCYDHKIINQESCLRCYLYNAVQYGWDRDIMLDVEILHR